MAIKPSNLNKNFNVNINNSIYTLTHSTLKTQMDGPISKAESAL